jgi:hypothetical protein
VTCFVMGSKLAPRERIRQEGSTRSIPLTDDTFIQRTGSRMLNRYTRAKDAAFLQAQGVDADQFSQPLAAQSLDLQPV